MSRPRVLVGFSACPLTRRALAEAGCEAFTCDLLPSRGDAEDARWHLRGDVWDALRLLRWDAAVLHPMCTYLTVSAAWAYGDGPYHQKVKPGTLVGQARRDAREQALDEFRRLLDLPFPVMIENPARSFVCTAIRKPDQTVHPYEFGDDASKATGLWLTRGMPALVVDPAHRVAGRRVDGRERWANQTDSGQNRLTPNTDRWLARSATYPGIARAIGNAVGAFLNR